MEFTRRFLCNLGIKLTLFMPLWMHEGIARAMQKNVYSASDQNVPRKSTPDMADATPVASTPAVFSRKTSFSTPRSTFTTPSAAQATAQ